MPLLTAARTDACAHAESPQLPLVVAMTCLSEPGGTRSRAGSTGRVTELQSHKILNGTIVNKQDVKTTEQNSSMTSAVKEQKCIPTSPTPLTTLDAKKYCNCIKKY